MSDGDIAGNFAAAHRNCFLQMHEIIPIDAMQAFPSGFRALGLV